MAVPALQALVSKEEDRGRDAWAAQLQQALLSLSNTTGASWRLTNALALALPQFPVLFGPEPLSDSWVSFAISKLVSGAGWPKGVGGWEGGRGPMMLGVVCWIGDELQGGSWDGKLHKVTECVCVLWYC